MHVLYLVVWAICTTSVCFQVVPLSINYEVSRSPSQGLPPKKEIPITNPESPAITLKRRRLHDDEEEDENDETKKPRTEETGFQFKANPVPDFSCTFKPQHEDRVPTLTEPFSFEERDKDKPTRESFVEMILRKSRVSHKCAASS